MKTVYKIVRSTGLRGVFISGFADTAMLEYRINQVTTPEFGKLFAFNTLKNAVAYMPRFRDVHRIFKASTTKCCKTKKRIGFRSTCAEYLKLLWQRKRVGIYTQPPPKGTVLCDDITLLEAVSTEEIEKARNELNKST